MVTTPMLDDRLPFQHADFTRLIWHSADAKSVWEPRISAVSRAWLEVERVAVARKLRGSALTFVQPEHLPQVVQWATEHGLVVLPLAQNGQTAQYSSTYVPVRAGEAWQYRIALTRPEIAWEWMRAWHGPQGVLNAEVGRLLGYPQCCREFFEHVWVHAQGVDTTWQMAGLTGAAHHDGATITVPSVGRSGANMMLRWLGVRLVSHLPCSFECAPSERMASRNLELMTELFPLEAEWIAHMLEWPVEWSALHGVGEIRTPVLTISTRTDATRKKRVVRYAGRVYPNEGARGLRFPFRIATGNVTEKPSFKRANVPIHELNGFGSAESMMTAHYKLLDLLKMAPVVPRETTILDLGCGAGTFLEFIQAVDGWRAAGVEVDPARAGSSKLPIMRADIFDVAQWAEHWDIVMLMPGRLLEVDAEKAERLRTAVLARSRYVLLYAYGDWLAKFGGLGPLCSEAGLGHGEVVGEVRGEGVAAVLCSFSHHTRDGSHP